MPRTLLATLSAASIVAVAGFATVAPAALHTTALTQPAEGVELPDGFAVLERSVEARGGQEKYLAIKNFVSTGSFSMPAMGIEGTITRTEAAPNHIHMHIVLGPFGSMVQATDGEVAWMIQPGQAEPVVMSGDQAKEMIEGAKFYDTVQPREKFESAETVGMEDVDGVSCYRLNLVSKSGQSSVAFYSVDTGLQVKNMSRTNPNAEDFDQVVQFSEWREVDGIMHPHVLKQKNMGNEFTITFDSYVHNTDIDNSIFSPPAPEMGEI